LLARQTCFGATAGMTSLGPLLTGLGSTIWARAAEGASGLAEGRPAIFSGAPFAPAAGFPLPPLIPLAAPLPLGVPVALATGLTAALAAGLPALTAPAAGRAADLGAALPADEDFPPEAGRGAGRLVFFAFTF
jgi:hypothetical protein